VELRKGGKVNIKQGVAVYHKERFTGGFPRSLYDSATCEKGLRFLRINDFQTAVSGTEIRGDALMFVSRGHDYPFHSGIG
jgi:hypothetical protein